MTASPSPARALLIVAAILASVAAFVYALSASDLWVGTLFPESGEPMQIALQLSQSPEQGPLDALGYALMIHNNTRADAGEVQVSIPIPPGFEFREALNRAICKEEERTLKCVLPGIPAREGVTLSVLLTAAPRSVSCGTAVDAVVFVHAAETGWKKTNAALVVGCL